LRAVGHSVAALVAAVGAPLAAAALAIRPAWRVGIRERMGRLPRLTPGAVWVHAASVGEILAASHLIDRLRESGRPVFASALTVNGREVMRRTRPEVPCTLAPLDHPWCVESALARIRPAVLVLVETELWPCWIAGAGRRGIPVVLVSGRLSDRSFPRYRRLGWLVGRTLRRLAAVGARTPADAERFRALGADPERVSVTGDLKLELGRGPGPLADDLDAVLGQVPLFVAGSTHPGEEAAALQALCEVERAGLRAALALAPRSPERAGEVRRTALGSQPLRAGEILLLDTVGELAPLYTRAAIAFVGGSLIPLGGQNLFEPILAGCPVLFGPHTADVHHAAEMLEGCLAGRRVEDAAGLGRAAAQLLRDPAAARALAEQGKGLLRDHGGSAERAVALVESVLSSRAVPAD
jgi:3-deoxy-D-manno-octulosonic-acid transferase